MVKLHKKIIAAGAAFLFILSMTLNTFAEDFVVGDFEYFSSVEFPHIDSTIHSRTGYIDFVDSREFLSWIVLYENLNLEFADFTTTPFAIQNLTYHYGDVSVDALTPTMIIGRLNVKQGLNSGWVMINGRPYDKSNGYIDWTASDGPAPFYISVSGVDPPGAAGPYTYGLTANSNNHVICYQPGIDDPLVQIYDKITTISVNMANMLSNNQDSLKNILSNIYTSCDNLEYSIADTNNYLSSLVTTTNSMNSKINQIYSQDGVTQSIIDDISDYLETELPVLDTDLRNINSELATFSFNFSNYADSVIYFLNSIDSNVTHIDETLDEMMEHFNGTALEGVSVPGSGAPNLWQLIKGAVSSGLSGLASLFNLIFGAIGNFASSASSGFEYMTSIDTYDIGSGYHPGFTNNILPSFSNTTSTIQGVTYTSNYPDITIVSVGGGTDTGSYTKQFYIIGSANDYPIHLDAGTYRLSAIGTNKAKLSLISNSNSGILARTMLNPINFTINRAMDCKLRIDCTNATEYSVTFQPTLIKVE